MIHSTFTDKRKYCTSTDTPTHTYSPTSADLYYLFSFTIFTNTEHVLNLICVKYYEISINV